MKTLTATALRANLFGTIQSVTRGVPVRVRSRWGTVLIVREQAASAGGGPKAPDVLQPKVPGRIVGSLDDADSSLRKHIRMPR